MKKVLLLVLILTIVAFAVVACSFNDVDDINISFYDGNNLITSSTLFKYKKSPVVPTKEGYTFDRWYLDMDCTKPADFDKITKDCSLYAGWRKVSDGKLSYQVSFCTQDGKTLKKIKISSFADITYPTPPTIDGQVFVGWSPLPEELTSDFIIYARYSKTYKVVFYLDKSDTTPWSEQIVNEGSAAAQPNEPAKPGDAQYYYRFDGWDKKFDNVTEDMVIYAKFSIQTHKYTTTFKNFDDTVIQSKSQYYGSKITVPNAIKDSDDTYVYIHIGWDTNGDGLPDELPETVLGNLEAVALYEKTLKTFTVNFYVDDNLLYSQKVIFGFEVDYKGSIPVKPSTAQYTYVFTGWDTTFDNITKDTDIHALFDANIRSYTYSFVDCTGKIFEQTAEYGTVIVAPEANLKPQDDAYTYPFSHWKDYENNMILDKDIVFEAVYTPIKRTFTYTFYIGKTVYFRGEAEYGTVIVAPDDPISTDGKEFVGWIGFKDGMIIEKDCSFYARFE